VQGYLIKPLVPQNAQTLVPGRFQKKALERVEKRFTARRHLRREGGRRGMGRAN
jgi:hypothetical protein